MTKMDLFCFDAQCAGCQSSSCGCPKEPLIDILREIGDAEESQRFQDVMFQGCDGILPARLKKIAPGEAEKSVGAAKKVTIVLEMGVLAMMEMWIQTVIQKKGESSMNYDRDLKANRNGLPRFAVFNYKRILEDRCKFFSALSRGVSLDSLKTKIPSYRRKEFLFWEFFDYKIPYARAAWVTKFCGILNFHNASNSKKKSLLDVATLEMSQSSNRFIVYMVSKLYKVEEDDATFKELMDMWDYSSGLILYMFNDGVMDKNEFLMDLTETRKERKKFYTCKYEWYHFTVYIYFFIQF
ncbi:hypothetical protein CAEBREN_08669 [Caenorhabditis brenneri]|uniref:Mediator complex subunit Med12 domain-containing protein n=1 Tax=Caenorhabditis brenneri TaxID=135651 RepID=G0NX43_CAEBE|nr:hypothetical protein CAEBREN_08669 [Caenorhabditis brenneri]